MSCAGRGILLRQIDRLFCDGTLAGLADGQLLERYLSSGDETAFEALVDRHGPMVLGLCRRMLRDPRDIEDAFQATFLVLVRTGRAIRDRSLVSTWLYRVAYRVARQIRTRTLRRWHLEIEAASSEAFVEPDAADNREVGAVLDQELNWLPEKYRAPLVLCYLEGRTHDQAADALRCPVGTVRSRLARGRDLLKKRLTRRGYAPTAAILAARSSLPAGNVTEPVPPSLVSATVKMALGPGSVPTIQAGAATASVLSLTQGAIMTMKLAQLKLIGLALLATALSAGGAFVVCFASAGMSQAAAKNAGLATGGAKSGAEPPALQGRAASPRVLKGWGEEIDPDGDCSFDVAEGQLTIKVPAHEPPRKGHGLEAEWKTLNAPRVLRDIEGDFIADLKVAGKFKPVEGAANPNSYPFVGAGLLLWSDAGTYIRLERAAINRNQQLIPYALFQERRNGVRVAPDIGVAIPDVTTVLRLERKGDQVTAFVSPDGKEWRALPTRTVALPAKLKLGVAAISSSREPFAVTLEGFRVLRPE